MTLPLLFALFTLAPAHAVNPGTPVAEKSAVVAVQAGTVYRVENDEVLTGGVTILIVDGKVTAIGSDVAVPGHARVVDYGADAVIVPGFVAANSTYGRPTASPRTADLDVLAADNFNPYGSYHDSLTAGVTSAYLPPARGRLIAGQGAVVKLGGDENDDRMLNASSVIHGAISSEARRTPGYWEPPVPATVDVGLGVEDPQLPRTTMGAVLALGELLALARGELDTDAYGPRIGPALRELIQAERPWRMGADDENEIRALIRFFSENDLPLVIDGARSAGSVVEEIAASGFPVIVQSPVAPNSGGRDVGKQPDDRWPVYDVAARLNAAGVRVAIATPNSVGARDLRYAAAVASRGGLSDAAALRAITQEPANILGVADRVGSLSVGKDADLVVLNGAPLDMTSGVVATWVAGEIAWKAHETSAVVVSVSELHVGDGEVISPGELLLVDGVIAEAGRSVSHPAGATVVRGFAAAPGMIDALGHLGLEGSTKAAPLNFPLARIVEPGDFADRQVAKAGVTTVALTPRGETSDGVRMTAYKPAGQDLDRMVVADPAAVRMTWTEKNRLESGAKVRSAIEKAAAYRDKWIEYEKQIAAWTPPAPAPADDEGDEDEEGEDEENGKDDADEKKDDKKKKKKKKKKDEPPKPLTGVWHADVETPEASFGPDTTRLRLRLEDEVSEEKGTLTGTLRCESLSDGLVEISGERDKLAVTLTGRGSRGTIAIEAESDNKGKLTGKVTLLESSIEFEAKQISTEYVVAKRPERRRPEKSEEPKGKPKSPGIDAKLEPLRKAMQGEGAVVVRVEREDEILECVAAFEAWGIKPVLYGGGDAWRVADKLKGRVSGVLLSHQVIRGDRKGGTRMHNRYAELQNAGIPVAFHSAAEEGAIDLPLMASYAISQGMSPAGALSALTHAAAEMLAIDERVGRLAAGMDADVLLLDGSPFDASTGVLRVWVNGREVR